MFHRLDRFTVMAPGGPPLRRGRGLAPLDAAAAKLMA
jgi:hypothetical protein